MGNLEHNHGIYENYPEYRFGRNPNSFRQHKNNSYITRNYRPKKNPFRSNKNYHNSKNDFWKTNHPKDYSEKFNKPFYQIKNKPKHRDADFIDDNDQKNINFKKPYNKYAKIKNDITRFHEKNKNKEVFEIEEELVDPNENKENISEENNKNENQNLSNQNNDEISREEKPSKKERKTSGFSLKSVSGHSKTNSTIDSLSINLKENNEDENQVVNFNQNNVNNFLMENVNNKIINPFLENTEILRVNVKVSKSKIAVFRLRRFDDLFETIKLFCEINCIEEKLIRPIIMKTISSLNIIYQIMNSNVNSKDVAILSEIKKRNKS